MSKFEEIIFECCQVCGQNECISDRGVCDQCDDNYLSSEMGDEFEELYETVVFRYCMIPEWYCCRRKSNVFEEIMRRSFSQYENNFVSLSENEKKIFLKIMKKNFE